MKKSKIISIIAAMLCILCLNACSGTNNSGQNDDTNNILQSEDKTSIEETSEKSSTTKVELTSDTKIQGNDVFVSDEEHDPSVYTDAQKAEYKKKVLDVAYKYDRAHPNSHYFSGPPEYLYQEMLIRGLAKPNMKKLQLDELKEYFRTHYDNEKGLDEYYREFTDSNGKKFMGYNSDELDEFRNKFAEWLKDKQAIADIHGYLQNYNVYWCDADTLTERREEILLPITNWIDCRVRYRTFDENGTMVNEEVIIDIPNHIYNF